MKITDLIEELEMTLLVHGDIEVTCTHALLPESEDVFETTVERLIVHEHETIGKCARLWL